MSDGASPMHDPAQPRWLSRRIAFAICAALLICFGLLSFTATLNKSATYDEPIHVLGGYVHRYFHDFRINFEDPALFGWWAALPHSDLALSVDITQPSFNAAATDPVAQWKFAVETLYRTKDNFPDSFLAVSRGQFTFLGVALGALIAWWSWRMAGALAAVAASALFCFDPNFAAHASLVKNDVALSLLMLALGYTTWQLGRSGGWWRTLLLALICGAAINTKFSGVLFVPMAAILLVSRALMRTDWQAGNSNLATVRARLAAVCVVLALTAVTTSAVTWAAYGFRYAPMRDGHLLDTNKIKDFAFSRELLAEIARREPAPRGPTQPEIDAHTLGTVPGAVVMLEALHILPQGWTYGFLYTYATTQIRSTFLLGEIRITGWWFYFPMAMIFKTPIATLIALIGALLLGLGRLIAPGLPMWAHLFRKERSTSAIGDPREDRRVDRWTALCLIVPPALYSLTAMSSNLNLGLRHILPVYPYLFVGVALCCATAVRVWGRRVLIALMILGAGLVIESVAAFPNYIPFFNLLSGRSRGGLALLGDSNLDWGQDLPALAKWHKSHNDRPLYLSYFGTADPEYYGIRYINLPGGYILREPYPLPSTSERCYVAISATNLQGIYVEGDPYSMLRNSLAPALVIGESIYIYEWPPTHKK